MAYPAQVFGIVSALYWKHMDLAMGSEHDITSLTHMMAEQISQEVGSGWSADGDKLIHINETEAFSLQWRAPDGQILYPMEQTQIERRPIEPADPIEHLAPIQPDFVNIEHGEQMHLENGLIMVIKQVGTMYAAIDEIKKELDKLKKLKYTAQLNFKQVTFRPVEDSK